MRAELPFSSAFFSPSVIFSTEGCRVLFILRECVITSLFLLNGSTWPTPLYVGGLQATANNVKAAERSRSALLGLVLSKAAPLSYLALPFCLFCGSVLGSFALPGVILYLQPVCTLRPQRCAMKCRVLGGHPSSGSVCVPKACHGLDSCRQPSLLSFWACAVGRRITRSCHWFVGSLPAFFPCS